MISDKRLIIITGAPASGKTTMGKRIAGALSIPFFDKDDILESLFDALGTGDHEWRTRLSRASDEIFLSILPQIQSAVAVSFWRHPRSESKISGTPISQLLTSKTSIIEVHCSCDHALAVERFRSRTRHAGHLDDAAGDERQLQTTGIRDYAKLGPLGIGHLIEVDTNGYSEHPYLEIVDGIKKIWAEADASSTT